MSRTPGPWKAHRAIWDKETGDVAYILEGVKEARAADSYLITAAPDMLEALEEVVAITENLPVCPFCSCALDHRPDCLSHEIDTAIQKARGEEMTDRWTYADGKVFDGNGILLAHVVYDHLTNFRRNCRMIAAAPDMLKMLLELQECAEYWSEYDVPLGIVGRLNETIRKARGGD